jgi:hypothetical protein
MLLLGSVELVHDHAATSPTHLLSTLETVLTERWELLTVSQSL